MILDENASYNKVLPLTKNMAPEFPTIGIMKQIISFQGNDPRRQAPELELDHRRLQLELHNHGYLSGRRFNARP